MTGRIQFLDKLGEEFARVASEAERPSRSFAAGRRLFRRDLRARTSAIAVGVIVLIASTSYAVPATRAAFDGVVDSFAGWVSGDETAQAPGRPVLPGDNVPTWLRGDQQTRLIAKTEGLGLYVRRSDTGNEQRLDFLLGQARGISGTVEELREFLGKDAAVVLGYTPFGPRDPLDAKGRVPVFGVTTRDVARVELRYSDGAPLTGKTGDGGFVLLADAWRPPQELIAYDSTGRVVDRIDVSEYDMRYLCDKDPVCPPAATSKTR